VELARPSAEIMVLDVFHALKEPASLALCTKAGGACDRSGTCPMHSCVWRELDDMIAAYLGKVDFATAANLGLDLETT
jgi:DNA-binding IscR family transcriptional regulator